MRDYGWFNEGMITSYPNILANQMGIDFKLPLFDAENYNGIERKVITSFNPTGGPAVKFKNVVNNLDINIEYGKEDNYSRRVSPFKGQTDNYATPFKLYSFFNRLDIPFKNGKDIGIYDFFILEIEPIELSIYTGAQVTPRTVEQLAQRDYKKYKENGFYENYTMMGASEGGAVYHDNVVRHLKNRGIDKGVIVNIIPTSLRKAKQKNYAVELANFMDMYGLGAIYTGGFNFGSSIPTGFSIGDIKNKDYFVSAQTSTMDSLLAPNVNINIKPALKEERPGYAISIEGTYEQQNRENTDRKVESSNKSLEVYSQYLNVPIFDLHGLYKAIHEDRYTTHDGIRVDPNFGSGNFFSLDGVTPSAFGQAVIANELIKTINDFYKTDIPLVDTRFFLDF